MWVEVFFLFLTSILLWQIFKKPSHLPPGPWGLPLLGYIPLRTKAKNLLKELNRKYGDIIFLRMGTQPVLLLYDYQTIREALNGPDMIDRPDLKMLSLMYPGETKQGIISTNGEHWQQIRRFVLRQLRDLGMGKSKLVEDIQREAMELVKSFQNQDGKPVSLSHNITTYVLNVIWQMVASKRYDENNEDIRQFKNLFSSIQQNIPYLLLPDFFTWFKYLPKSIVMRLTKETTYKQLSNKMSNFLQMAIEEHEKNLDPDNPRDFIDSYLVEMKNQQEDPSSHMSYEDLLFCLADLFGAGTETSSATLEWCILYLATHPNIQSRIQADIDQVLKGSLVTLQDKARLPYLDAFIHEVLRHSSLVSGGVFHRASVDTKVAGYQIPKGTMVISALSWSHYDSKHFPAPLSFQPERFLSSEGKFISPREGFLPFGIGKRQCVGESLARMEIFIFLTTMLQHLKFTPVPGQPLDLTPIDNPFINMPNHNQQVMVKTR